jgi:hypothetical protein
MRDVLGWSDPVLECFEIDEALAKSCGWVWWHENVLSISDRPRTLNRDDELRLHCETGPAIMYPDGWGLWCWHGTVIPQEWVESKESLNLQTALTWENIEQRRAACEILGWNLILDQLNARTIDKHPNAEIGDLVEVDLPDSGRERFLRVKCGTGRDFAIPVPPDMDTAHNANAWTYGLDANELNPEVRT